MDTLGSTKKKSDERFQVPPSPRKSTIKQSNPTKGKDLPQPSQLNINTKPTYEPTVKQENLTKKKNTRPELGNNSKNLNYFLPLSTSKRNTSTKESANSSFKPISTRPTQSKQDSFFIINTKEKKDDFFGSIGKTPNKQAVPQTFSSRSPYMFSNNKNQSKFVDFFGEETDTKGGNVSLMQGFNTFYNIKKNNSPEKPSSKSFASGGGLFSSGPSNEVTGLSNVAILNKKFNNINNSNKGQSKILRNIESYSNSMKGDANSKSIYNRPVVTTNKPELELNSKSYFAYSPGFLMKKNAPSTTSSIFTDRSKKSTKPSESNSQNYYKNFFVNTENFFSKNSDPSSPKEGGGRFTFKDFNSPGQGQANTPFSTRFDTRSKIIGPLKVDFENF